MFPPRVAQFGLPLRRFKYNLHLCTEVRINLTPDLSCFAAKPKGHPAILAVCLILVGAAVKDTRGCQESCRNYENCTSTNMLFKGALSFTFQSLSQASRYTT